VAAEGALKKAQNNNKESKKDLCINGGLL